MASYAIWARQTKSYTVIGYPSRQPRLPCQFRITPKILFFMPYNRSFIDLVIMDLDFCLDSYTCKKELGRTWPVSSHNFLPSCLVKNSYIIQI